MKAPSILTCARCSTAAAVMIVMQGTPGLRSGDPPLTPPFALCAPCWIGWGKRRG